MVQFSHFTLENGLRVYVHEDHSTPMAVVNVLYDVGSRDEDENKTGFAHLFEHLMFGGSSNIPSYDEPVQRVGGENNAFTTPDITNYYISLPAINLETALWLESDRMMSLSFDEEVLEVQRKVVIEEFKQRYLNQPYGDLWLKLRPLAYQQHPYRWATIGKEISHIENATMEDVKAFFFQYYRPDNAILVVAGNVKTEEVKVLVEKWFTSIPAGGVTPRNLPVEPKQTLPRFFETSANVPLNAIVKAWHIPGRFDRDFVVTDLLSDVLGRGKSSLLYHHLLKENPFFNSISASTTASLDPGLLLIRGFLNPGVSLEEADRAITDLLTEFLKAGPTENEVLKVKNQAEATLAFAEVELLNRAMNLAYAASAGDASLINQDAEKIAAVTSGDIHSMAKKILVPENCSTIYYRSQQN